MNNTIHYKIVLCFLTGLENIEVLETNSSKL